jgi:myosin I
MKVVFPLVWRQSLTMQSTRAGRRSSFSMKKLTVATAEENRDALCKELYNVLFNWLVDRINVAVKGTVAEDARYIGVLDIFGFEIFEVRSPLGSDSNEAIISLCPKI